jgi:predicted DNA-binding transcriptional regulator AlpA
LTATQSKKRSKNHCLRSVAKKEPAMIADVPHNDFPSDAAPEPLLTTSQAIRLIANLTGCRVSRSTIWRWYFSGRLPATRVGGRLFASERQVREMLAQDSAMQRPTTAARGIAAANRLAMPGRTARQPEHLTGGQQ